MDAQELRERSRQFAVRAIRFCRQLPEGHEARRIGAQLMDSASSVAATYRVKCRARTRTEFIAKLGIVVEEADETLGWLQLNADLGLAADHDQELKWLLKESGELLAIFAASQKTAKNNRRNRP